MDPLTMGEGVRLVLAAVGLVVVLFGALIAIGTLLIAADEARVRRHYREQVRERLADLRDTDAEAARARIRLARQRQEEWRRAMQPPQRHGLYMVD